MIGLVEENGGARHEIEDGSIGSGDGSVELPSGKDVEATGADGGFDDFFVAGDALAAKPRVNCAEKMFADGSFGEREEHGFVDGIGRALGGGIELANGFGFIAEEFDAQRGDRIRGSRRRECPPRVAYWPGISTTSVEV